MKLKRTRRERCCTKCKIKILKGDFYAQKSVSISDNQGQSIDGGKTWTPLKITAKKDICAKCANQ